MANVVVALPAQFITRAEAARLAEQCARVLVEQFGAKRVIPFGSVTGDSPWHSRSDIDLAVEGLAPKVFFTAWVALDPLLPPGLEVDLHDLKELPPELRARILGEVKMPKENIPALKFEIEAELKSLQRVVDKVIEYLPRTGESDEPEQVMIAKYLHDFYNGVEHIFERIAVRLDGGLPSGDFWHTQLLEGMVAPVEGVRPAVIDSKLHKQLYEFLKFRHRIRHVYSYDLEWPRVKERAVELEEIMRQLRKALETFTPALGEKGQAPEDGL
jgi:predicted nucleotidyltransferase